MAIDKERIEQLLKEIKNGNDDIADNQRAIGNSLADFIVKGKSVGYGIYNEIDGYDAEMVQIPELAEIEGKVREINSDINDVDALKKKVDEVIELCDGSTEYNTTQLEKISEQLGLMSEARNSLKDYLNGVIKEIEKYNKNKNNQGGGGPAPDISPVPDAAALTTVTAGEKATAVDVNQTRQNANDILAGIVIDGKPLDLEYYNPDPDAVTGDMQLSPGVLLQAIAAIEDNITAMENRATTLQEEIDELEEAIEKDSAVLSGWEDPLTKKWIDNTIEYQAAQKRIAINTTNMNNKQKVLDALMGKDDDIGDIAKAKKDLEKLNSIWNQMNKSAKGNLGLFAAAEILGDCQYDENGNPVSLAIGNKTYDSVEAALLIDSLGKMIGDPSGYSFDGDIRPEGFEGGFYQSDYDNIVAGCHDIYNGFRGVSSENFHSGEHSYTSDQIETIKGWEEEITECMMGDGADYSGLTDSDVFYFSTVAGLTALDMADINDSTQFQIDSYEAIEGYAEANERLFVPGDRISQLTISWAARATDAINNNQNANLELFSDYVTEWDEYGNPVSYDFSGVSEEELAQLETVLARNDELGVERRGIDLKYTHGLDGIVDTVVDYSVEPPQVYETEWYYYNLFYNDLKDNCTQQRLNDLYLGGLANSGLNITSELESLFNSHGDIDYDKEIALIDKALYEKFDAPTMEELAGYVKDGVMTQEFYDWFNQTAAVSAYNYDNTNLKGIVYKNLALFADISGSDIDKLLDDLYAEAAAAGIAAGTAQDKYVANKMLEMYDGKEELFAINEDLIKQSNELNTKYAERMQTLSEEAEARKDTSGQFGWLQYADMFNNGLVSNLRLLESNNNSKIALNNLYAKELPEAFKRSGAKEYLDLFKNKGKEVESIIGTNTELGLLNEDIVKARAEMQREYEKAWEEFFWNKYYNARYIPELGMTNPDGTPALSREEADDVTLYNNRWKDSADLDEQHLYELQVSNANAVIKAIEADADATVREKYGDAPEAGYVTDELSAKYYDDVMATRKEAKEDILSANEEYNAALDRLAEIQGYSAQQAEARLGAATKAKDKYYDQVLEEEMRKAGAFDPTAYDYEEAKEIAKAAAAERLANDETYQGLVKEYEDALANNLEEQEHLAKKARDDYYNAAVEEARKGIDTTSEEYLWASLAGTEAVELQAYAEAERRAKALLENDEKFQALDQAFADARKAIADSRDVLTRLDDGPGLLKYHSKWPEWSTTIEGIGDYKVSSKTIVNYPENPEDYESYSYETIRTITFFDRNGKEIEVSPEIAALYLYTQGADMPALYKMMSGNAAFNEIYDMYNAFDEKYFDTSALSSLIFRANANSIAKDSLGNISFSFNQNSYINSRLNSLIDNARLFQGIDMAYKRIDIYRSLSDTPVIATAYDFLDGVFVDGLSQFGEGFTNFFSGYISTRSTAREYKNQYLNSFFTEEYGSWFQGTYELGSVWGNMLPSIALSMVAQPLGLSLMFVSSAGNYELEGLRDGMTMEQAVIYGMLSGLSEVALEKAIGGLPGLSDIGSESAVKGLRALLIKMHSEGREEFVQDLLSPYFKAIAISAADGFQARNGTFQLFTSASGNAMNFFDVADEIDWAGAIHSYVMGALSGGLGSVGTTSVQMYSKFAFGSYDVVSDVLRMSITDSNGKVFTDAGQMINGVSEFFKNLNKVAELKPNIEATMAKLAVDPKITEQFNEYNSQAKPFEQVTFDEYLSRLATNIELQALNNTDTNINFEALEQNKQQKLELEEKIKVKEEAKLSETDAAIISEMDTSIQEMQEEVSRLDNLIKNPGTELSDTQKVTEGAKLAERYYRAESEKNLTDRIKDFFNPKEDVQSPLELYQKLNKQKNAKQTELAELEKRQTQEGSDIITDEYLDGLRSDIQTIDNQLTKLNQRFEEAGLSETQIKQLQRKITESTQNAATAFYKYRTAATEAERIVAYSAYESHVEDINSLQEEITKVNENVNVADIVENSTNKTAIQNLLSRIFNRSENTQRQGPYNELMGKYESVLTQIGSLLKLKEQTKNPNVITSINERIDSLIDDANNIKTDLDSQNIKAENILKDQNKLDILKVLANTTALSGQAAATVLLQGNNTVTDSQSSGQTRIITTGTTETTQTQQTNVNRQSEVQRDDVVRHRIVDEGITITDEISLTQEEKIRYSIHDIDVISIDGRSASLSNIINSIESAIMNGDATVEGIPMYKALQVLANAMNKQNAKIELSENVSRVLEAINSLKENETLLNYTDVLNGKKPVIVSSEIVSKYGMDVVRATVDNINSNKGVQGKQMVDCLLDVAKENPSALEYVSSYNLTSLIKDNNVDIKTVFENISETKKSILIDSLIESDRAAFIRDILPQLSETDISNYITIKNIGKFTNKQINEIKSTHPGVIESIFEDSASVIKYLAENTDGPLFMNLNTKEGSAIFGKLTKEAFMKQMYEYIMSNTELLTDAKQVNNYLSINELRNMLISNEASLRQLENFKHTPAYRGYIESVLKGETVADDLYISDILNYYMSLKEDVRGLVSADVLKELLTRSNQIQNITDIVTVTDGIIKVNTQGMDATTARNIVNYIECVRELQNQGYDITTLMTEEQIKTFDQVKEYTQLEVSKIIASQTSLVNQGAVANIMLSSDPKHQLLKEQLINQLRTRYKGMTRQEATRFLMSMEATETSIGICNYADVANAIFSLYTNDIDGARKFQEAFGFALYRDGHLNETQLLVDMFANMSGLIKEENGQFVIPESNNGYIHLVNALESRDATYVTGLIAEYLKQKGIDATDINVTTRQIHNSINTDITKIDKVEAVKTIIAEVTQALANGEHISISGDKGLLLLNMSTNRVNHLNEAHIMTVYGIDSQGRLLVDTQGQKCAIDLMQNLDAKHGFLVDSLNLNVNNQSVVTINQQNAQTIDLTQYQGQEGLAAAARGISEVSTTEMTPEYEEYLQRVLSGTEKVTAENAKDVMNYFLTHQIGSNVQTLIDCINMSGMYDKYIQMNGIETFSQQEIHYLIDTVSIIDRLTANNITETEDLEIVRNIRDAINKGLIENTITIDTEHYQRHIVSFANEYARINGFKHRVTLITENSQRAGYYSYKDGTIFLNTNFLKSDSVVQNIETIFHEYHHLRQEIQATNNTIHNEFGEYSGIPTQYSLMYTVDMTLSDYVENYYSQNYTNAFFEIDARYNAAISTVEYLKSIIGTEAYSQRYASEFEAKIQEELSKYDLNENMLFDYKKQLAINRDVLLERQIKASPRIVMYRPMLSYIFNVDGSRKTLSQLYEIIKTHNNNQYVTDMINYWISHSEYSVESIIDNLYEAYTSDIFTMPEEFKLAIEQLHGIKLLSALRTERISIFTDYITKIKEETSRLDKTKLPANKTLEEFQNEVIGDVIALYKDSISDLIESDLRTILKTEGDIGSKLDELMSWTGKDTLDIVLKEGNFTAEQITRYNEYIENTTNTQINAKSAMSEVSVLDVSQLDMSEGNNFSKDFYNHNITYKGYNHVVKSENSLIDALNNIKDNNITGNILIELTTTEGLTQEAIDMLPDNISVRILGGYTDSYIHSYRNVRDVYSIMDKVTYTKSQLQSIYAEISKIESGINPEWSDLQKAQYIYDYLSNGDNITYNPKPEGGNQGRPAQFDGLMSLVSKESTCNGFAHTYQVLLQRQGIECSCLSGRLSETRTNEIKRTSHAFNAVTIDGHTFLVDTVKKYQSGTIKEGTGFGVKLTDIYKYNINRNQVVSEYDINTDISEDGIMHTMDNSELNAKTALSEVSDVDGEYLTNNEISSQINEQSTWNKFLDNAFNTQYEKLYPKTIERYNFLENANIKPDMIEYAEDINDALNIDKPIVKEIEKLMDSQDNYVIGLHRCGNLNPQKILNNGLYLTGHLSSASVSDTVNLEENITVLNRNSKGNHDINLMLYCREIATSSGYKTYNNEGGAVLTKIPKKYLNYTETNGSVTIDGIKEEYYSTLIDDSGPTNKLKTEYIYGYLMAKADENYTTLSNIVFNNRYDGDINTESNTHVNRFFNIPSKEQFDNVAKQKFFNQNTNTNLDLTFEDTSSTTNLSRTRQLNAKNALSEVDSSIADYGYHFLADKTTETSHGNIINGALTIDDVESINQIPFKKTLIIENTRGLTSEIISMINNDNITFSVLDGLNYFEKTKYNSDNYIERTMISPKGLAEVIKYFESIESMMKPEWTDTQKCMFLYDSIVRDFTYQENFDSKMDSEVVNRGLYGVLYKKLVCAGFANVFKEGLDRLGIENVYQNRRHHHAWNIVKLDGQWRGLEITWDCCDKKSDNVCQYKYFGQMNKEEFYNNRHHDLYLTELADPYVWYDRTDEMEFIKKNDPEEIEYDIVPFTIEELKANYRTIRPQVEAREVNQAPLFKNSEEEYELLPKKETIEMHNIKETAIAENKYINLYKFLKNNGMITDNRLEFLRIRNAYLSDVVANKLGEYEFRGNDIGIESLNDSNFHSDGSYNTQYGIKLISGERITDSEKMNQIFDTLNNRLEEYAVSYLENIYENVDELINKHREAYNSNERINSLYSKPSELLSYEEADIYTKLQSLLEGRELLESSGISSELIQAKIDKINSYMDELKSKHTVTEEMQKANDIDFLEGVFAYKDEVRKICEEHDGHTFTEEEWQEKNHDVDYMQRYIDYATDLKSAELNIKPEHFKEALNKIFANSTTEINAKNAIEEVPYNQVAKKALMEWNQLSEEEANDIIAKSTYEEIESQVYATSSVTAAVNEISRQINLTEAETQQFLDCVFGRETNPQLLRDIGSKVLESNSDITSIIVDVIDAVHNNWINDNEGAFFTKKQQRRQQYQYLPLELIGIKEAKSDLLFIRPIMESMSIDAVNNEELIEQELRSRRDEVLKNIHSEEDLVNYIQTIEYVGTNQEIRNTLSNPEFIKETLIPELTEKGYIKDINSERVLSEKSYTEDLEMVAQTTEINAKNAFSEVDSNINYSYAGDKVKGFFAKNRGIGRITISDETNSYVTEARYESSNGDKLSLLDVVKVLNEDTSVKQDGSSNNFEYSFAHNDVMNRTSSLGISLDQVLNDIIEARNNGINIKLSSNIENIITIKNNLKEGEVLLNTFDVYNNFDATILQTDGNVRIGKKIININNVFGNYKANRDNLARNELSEVCDALKAYELLRDNNLSDNIVIDEGNLHDMYNYFNAKFIYSNTLNTQSMFNFTYAFTKYFARINGLSAQVKFYEGTAEEYGYSEQGIIGLNNRIAILNHNSSYMDTLNTIFHEVFHEIQHMEKDSNKYTLGNTIERVIRNDNPSYYSANYDLILNEIDARYNAAIITLNYLENIAPDKSHEFLEKYNQELEIERANYEVNRNIYTKDDITLNRDAALENIVKNNPDVLKANPVLEYIFNPDGTRKTLYELADVIKENSNNLTITNMINHWVKTSSYSLETITKEYFEVYKNGIDNLPNEFIEVIKNQLDQKLFETILVESNAMDSTKLYDKMSEIIKNYQINSLQEGFAKDELLRDMKAKVTNIYEELSKTKQKPKKRRDIRDVLLGTNKEGSISYSRNTSSMISGDEYLSDAEIAEENTWQSELDDKLGSE